MLVSEARGPTITKPVLANHNIILTSYVLSYVFRPAR